MLPGEVLTHLPLLPSLYRARQALLTAKPWVWHSLVWHNAMFDNSFIWKILGYGFFPFREAIKWQYLTDTNGLLIIGNCDSVFHHITWQPRLTYANLRTMPCTEAQGPCQLRFDYFSLHPTTATADLSWSPLLIFLDETLMGCWFRYTL